MCRIVSFLFGGVGSAYLCIPSFRNDHATIPSGGAESLLNRSRPNRASRWNYSWWPGTARRRDLDFDPRRYHALFDVRWKQSECSDRTEYRYGGLRDSERERLQHSARSYIRTLVG